MGSWTQSILALSSGESEFHAAVNSGSIGLGGRGFMENAGQEIKHIELGVEANAAKGILSRRGVGKVRHLALPVM